MNCTLGGMIGNNSCGATAQRTGKVVDNIAALEVLLYDGTRFWCGPTSDEEYEQIERRGDRRAEIYRRLRALRDTYGDEIGRRYPKIPRRVSGYNLDSLLPEYGFDVGGLLVGSESTLVTVLRAELKLVPVLPERTLVVLGYPSIDRAADAVPAIVEHNPIALEGWTTSSSGTSSVKRLNPRPSADAGGRGVADGQFGGQTGGGRPAAERMLTDAARAASTTRASSSSTTRRKETSCGRSASRLGATARVAGRAGHLAGLGGLRRGARRLGDYLRDLQKLYDEFGYSDAVRLYGHFGQGCVHTRIPFDLYSADGVAEYRAVHRARRRPGGLVRRLAVGRARRRPVPGRAAAGCSAADLVARVRRAEGDLRPGQPDEPGQGRAPRTARPAPPAGRRLDATRRAAPVFQYPDDGGSFARRPTRCVGVGKCRQHEQRRAVMCPSYRSPARRSTPPAAGPGCCSRCSTGTRDSPDHRRLALDRGHATPSTCAWPARAARPTARSTSTWRPTRPSSSPTTTGGRCRPRGALLDGLAAAVARRSPPGLPRVVNASPTHPSCEAVARPGGIASRGRSRCSPARPCSSGTPGGRRRRRGRRRGRVLLWPDTFTNYFHPHVGRAAVEVLEAAGWEVEIPAEPLCCGLTWISTGQLTHWPAGAAAAPWTRWPTTSAAGGLVVGLEPSCTAVFRSDAADLFPGDQDMRRLRDQTVTLAELLTEHTPGWQPPKVAPRGASRRCTATSTPCCGFDADQAARGAGARRPRPWTSGAAAWPATSASSRALRRVPGA